MRSDLITAVEWRRINIVEQLSDATEWIQVEDLAANVGCSFKTLGADLKFFEESWSQYFKIEFSKKRGLRLHQDPRERVSSIYEETLQNSQIWNFFEALFFHPFKNGDYWQRELFISSSSMYRYVSQMNKSMNKIGIVIEKNPFLITGKSERAVCLHVANYFSNAYRLDQNPFPEINRKKLISLVDLCNEELRFYLNDESKKEFANIAAVALIRMKQGFVVDDFVDNSMVQKCEEWLLAHEREVREVLDFQLPKNWEKSFASTVMMDAYAFDTKAEREKISTCVYEFVENLSAISNVPIDALSEEKLVRRMITLYAQYKTVPYVRKRWFHYRHSQKEETRRLFPIFFSQFSKELHYLERRTRAPWYSVCACFILDIIFENWPNLMMELERRRTKVKILVCTIEGHTHARALGDFIVNNVGTAAEIHLFKGTLLYEGIDDYKEFEEANIIATTNNVKWLPQEKVFVVDHIPTPTQLAAIDLETSRLQLLLHTEKTVAQQIIT